MDTQRQNQITLWQTIKTPFWLLLYIAVLVFLVFFFPFNLFPVSDDAIRITQGERLEGKFKSINSLPQQSWETVQLPDNWSQTALKQDAWYRFDVPNKALEAESYAIYLPAVRQNVAVYLNGQWLGQGGRFENPIARLWNHPLFFDFASELLNADHNTLHIRLATNRDTSGYLSEVYIAPSGILLPAWQQRNFYKVDLLELVSYLMIVIGLINFTLWTLRRQDTYYLWFGFAATVWGARSYLLLLTELPIPDGTWDGLRLLLLGYGVAFGILFNQRFFADRNKLADWVIALYCIPAALPMLFMDIDTVHVYGHQVWGRLIIVLALYVLFYLYRVYRNKGQASALMLLYAGIPLFVVGLRDLMVLNDHWNPHNGFLVSYASIPILILALWFILQRFAHSLTEAENLNISLDQRVKDKEYEIRRQYKKQEEMHEQQLLNEERERIMRDMHDGLGGHLISLKALADDQQTNKQHIRSQVDSALVDLRLVINSLDVTSQSISTLLGSMRTRWQQLSQSQNIKLIWKVSSEVRSNKLGPTRTLQIMRILEEAFTNCIKHSDATEITVSNGVDTETIWIMIRDNGQSSNKSSSGRGIDNMHHRANRIGAILNIEGTTGGQIVRLSLSND